MEIAGRLNKSATMIEAAAYDVGLPIVVVEIAVLGDQCRFYAVQACGNRELLAEIGQRLHLSRVDPGASIFKHLNKMQAPGKDMIRAALGLPAYAGFSIDISDGYAVFDFSLSDIVGREYFVPLDVNELSAAHKHHIPIGRTLESEEVVLDLNDPRHAHILIAGQTGVGKTVLGNTILYGIARAYRPGELGLLTASGKPEDIEGWQGLPHLLAEPSHNPDDALAMLVWLEQQRSARASGADRSQRLAMYLGEVSVLCELNPTRFSSLLEKLVRLGRSENITMICATQRPRGDQVGTVVARSQFTLILCGRVQNPQDSYLALGQGGQQAEFLPGRGAFKSNSGVRFQAAMTSKDSVKQLTGSNHPGNEFVELPDSGAADDVSIAPDADVEAVLKWIQEENVKDISASSIRVQMAWGHIRASRAFKALQRAGAVGEERNDMRRVEVLLGSEEDGDC